ncbi:hypothetical protein CVU75_02435, partial [Candidatus Dependentiae bacterium HGW-Dependentiae-1]
GKKVTQFRTGDFVACADVSCAHHADIVCVPDHLIVKIAQAHLKTASMTAIGASALQGVRRAQLSLGDTVAVFGLGLVGQLTAQLAKAAGCTVLVVDEHAERIARAKELGADYGYLVSQNTLQQEISLVTQHVGVDVSFITGASEKENVLLQQRAVDATRAQGKVVIIGQESCTIQRHEVQRKDIAVLLSPYTPGRLTCAAQYSRYGSCVSWSEQRTMQEFVRLLESEKLAVEPLITKEILFDQVPETQEHLKDPLALSTVISYQPDEQAQNSVEAQSGKGVACSDARSCEKNSLCRFVPAIKSKEQKIRVAIIGAGRFARLKLMPLLTDMPGISLNAIIDVDRTRALTLARVHGIDQVFASVDDFFAHEQGSVDAIIVASPYTLHADQVIKAVQHGKAVFAERPLITDPAQYERIKKMLDTYPQAPLCVGYTSAFSPFMQKIKKHIKERYTPLMISYRMNSSIVPQEFWIHADFSVGRVVGHACMIIDLFCYLTDAKPVSVSVEALHAAKEDIFPTDNFSVQLSFDDGSLCSLVYTALGHQELGKERMEVFFDGKSILMNNYRQLHGFGLPTLFNEVVTEPDKGHKAALQAFFDALRKPTFVAPVPFDRLKLVSELTLLIDKLVCSGGGAASFVPAKAAVERDSYGASSGAHKTEREREQY